jgi:hypothetical protein
MTAIAVNVFVIEAIRKTVSSVTGVCAAGVGESATDEALQTAVADDTDPEPDGRVAVQDRVD